MQAARRLLRTLGTAVVALFLAALAAFAALQTPPGRTWLARTVAAAASRPDRQVAIDGLEGIVPLRMRVARIAIADRSGTFFSLRDLRFEMGAAALARGRVEVRELRIGDVDFARLPAGGSATPHADQWRVPGLRFALAVDRFAIDRLAFAAPIFGEPVAAAVASHGAIDRNAARLRLYLDRIDGRPGGLRLNAALAGTPPILTFDLAAREPSGLVLDRLLGRSDHLPLSLTIAGSGPLSGWTGRLALSAGAEARVDARLRLAVDARPSLRLDGMATPGPLLPAGSAPILGRHIGLVLRLEKAPGAIVLDRVSIDLAVGRVTGRGSLAGSSLTGELHAEMPELRAVGRVFGLSLGGSAGLDATLRGNTSEPLFDAKLSAHAENLRTGFLAADALLGDRVIATAAVRRGPTGALGVDRFALSAAGATVTGSGSFASDTRHLAADLAFAVPRLEPLGAALGRHLAGALTVTARAAGPVDRPRLDAAIEGGKLGFDGARLDRLRLDVRVVDPALRQGTLDGSFRAAGLAGTVALAAELRGGWELIVPRLRLAAGGAAIDGNLRVALDSGLVAGRLAGRIPNLAPWSRLAGLVLGGSAAFTAAFAAERGQQLDLTVTGSGLAVGAGTPRVAVGRADLGARLAGLRQVPTGGFRLALAGIRSGRLALAVAHLGFDALRPGRFSFQGDVAGTRLNLSFAGDAGSEPGGAATGYGLRLARFAGTAGGEPVRLEAPLLFSWHDTDRTMSGLDLQLGPGRITGAASLRGQAVALNLTAAGLRLTPGARLLGQPNLRGILTASTTLGGTVGAPRGHLAAAIDGLGFAASAAGHVPRLGLSLSADWNGRVVALDGRLSGIAGATARFGGSLPLSMSAKPLSLSLPREGRLALRLEGEGEIGRLADLLPIGEDRLAGRFTADLRVSGTVAAPDATGRLALAQGRYQNFATGAVLQGLDAVLTGDRDRLALTSFSASDGAGGKIAARGAVTLSGAAGPTADFGATLAGFRVAASDEALIKASGEVRVKGPLGALEVSAPLTINRADINLPDRLPPEIVVLEVTRTGGPVVGAKPEAPASVWPAALDIRLSLPGQVFVRGHGLDSEWRGRITITGASAAPRINGALDLVRGSFSLLGKSFRVTRGRIVFDGGSRPDPVLDIVAQAVASDITAEITIGGLASAPKITLASIPRMPQDEILSRLLFNQGKGQLSAGQGLQLAQAAAALSGQNFDVLARVRGGLGLDWLGFGSGPQGAAPSIVNPNPYNAAQANGAGSAISAGKYIARGVSIGVTQGVSPPTSRVTVEIQLGNHLTIDTQAGQNSGTGVGINYNYNY
jgi:translocation and assembly module TamB